jgi:hypothetical protein
MGRQRWTIPGMERVTLHSSFTIVVWRASRSWYGANVDGKKKVMRKQIRSREMEWQEKDSFVARSGV